MRAFEFDTDIASAEFFRRNGVEPEPQKGSSTSPFAGQKAAISGFRASTGFSVG
jgi:hypothetical protein